MKGKLEILLNGGITRIVQRWKHPAFFGSLHRLTPLSNVFGYDRGLPIDRYYIEHFLEQHRTEIHGHILEISDTRYTERYGRNITKVDILSIDENCKGATIVADLADANVIPSNSFDCFLLCQTLQYVSNLESAIRHSHRILKIGGTLLVSIPGIQRADPGLLDFDLWRFTPAICKKLFEKVFGKDHTTIHVYGNVLSAISSLMGVAYQELRSGELDYHDPTFPVVICICARKIN